jgi:V/A-type H+-transporting ATPase subunit E
MKGLDSGKNKIQKICDALRAETLEPARQEAREIIENAHLQAAELLREAREKTQSLVQEAERSVAQERNAFESSMQMACRQSIELLKQKIEHEILFAGLAEIVSTEMSDSQWIVQLIQGCLQILREKGIEEDLSVVIPRSLSPRAINSMLVQQFIEHLKEKSVVVGGFDGGIQIQLRGRQIVIDISDQVIRELIAGFIRPDFRELVFQD